MSTDNSASDTTVVAELGSSINLTCLTTINKPVIKYSWSKDGTFIQETVTSILTINNVSFDDIGQYGCSVVSDACTVAPSASTQLNTRCKLSIQYIH